jgi:hypothetical protein
MYTCVPCDQDWCPNCFAMIMQNKTTLKSVFIEDKEAITEGQVFVVQNFDQRITRPEFDEKFNDIKDLIAKIKLINLDAKPVDDTAIAEKENSVKLDEENVDEKADEKVNEKVEE